MKKVSLLLSSGALAIMLGVAPFTAFAHEADKDSLVVRPNVNISQSVQINNNGAVTLHGVVTAVASAGLTVKSWGGDWSVAVASDTKLVSRTSATITLADIKVGDYVAVRGAMHAGTGLSIDAKEIKDKLLPDRKVTLKGSILSLGANSLTVQSDSQTWTVNVGASSKVLSKFNIATTLGAMKVNDQVVVQGTLGTNSASVIEATEVKDVSLPLNAVTRVGTIANVADSTFTLVTKQRNDNDVKVTTDTATTITVNGTATTSADIKNDSRATVQGVLNSDTGVLSAIKVMVGNMSQKDQKNNGNHGGDR